MAAIEKAHGGEVAVNMTAGDARKQDVATAIGETSRVWFTLARGRLDDVYYPRPDVPCVRALRVRVGDVDDEAMDHACVRPHDMVPLLVVETRNAPYEMTKETIADPRSDVVLQRVSWHSAQHRRLRVALETEREPVRCGALDRQGRIVLAADLGKYAVALAASAPWAACSGLAGELEIAAVTLALGFGHTTRAAAHVAIGAITRGFSSIRDEYVAEWCEWHGQLARRSSRPLWVRSACVLKTLEAKHVDGGRVAALSKPWGAARPARAWGSYHLVWTRDLVETMGGLIAAGTHDEARQALTFLGVTQRPDGHWPQNMTLDGTRVWRGDESDETALPILLVDLLRREGILEHDELEQAWPMVARAAARLTTTGPSSRLDRWEDVSGITPFTLATEIAGLRIASALADELGHAATAHRFGMFADRWDNLVDEQLFRRGGPLAERLGIDGYYIRARIPGEPLPAIDPDSLPPTELSPDALALVRFGVRAADDPRIADTVRAIDAVLRTPVGWRRYPGDLYGEHTDGSPWDGTGIGRSWPLLVGERAHYELARGDSMMAERLCAAMARLASATGMLPEQTWDAPDIPQHQLWCGGPTHSAAPLGWAHAEYVKLCRSLAEGKVFDLPSVCGRTKRDPPA